MLRAAPLPRRAALALTVAVARSLVRHPELRHVVVASVAVPAVAAVALRTAFGIGDEPLVLFAVGLTLVAAAMLPPAAHGLTRDARWLTASAPTRREVVGACAAAAGAAVAFALVAAALLAVAPVARADVETLASLEATLGVVAGVSAATGAVVPWRQGRALDQLAAFVVAGIAIVAVGTAAGQLVGDSTAAGLVGGNAVLAAGIAAAAVAAR